MKSLIALVSAATMSIAVAGCNVSTTPDLNTFIRDVQGATVTACGFLPFIDTLTAIFNVNAAIPAITVAQAICNAVKPTDHPAAAQPTIIVNGKTVPVHGMFVGDK